MKSALVRSHRLPVAGALAAAVVLAGAGFSAAAPKAPEEKVQVVHVLAKSQADRTKVNELGLDTTEHGDDTGVEVILHGKSDAAKLRAAGFTWRVEDADLAATMRQARAADQAYAAAVAESGLPSGSTSYRTLDEINAELDQLAKDYPKLVRKITLPNLSVEGRQVRGIEITTNAANVDDGKPVFLMMGAHHAREWPSVEHSMEFAYDLLTNNGSDARTTNIVANSRTIIVPVVNVDGFHISRSAAPLGNFSRFDYEMKRKNCSISAFTTAAFLGGTCAANPAGRERGTDPNRNYPGFWGGPGASTNYRSDTYRGDAPGDTPEVDNIKQLISSRQVTNLITNHTYSNLVLRPPSLLSTGYSPDEPAYKALGASMTDDERLHQPGLLPALRHLRVGRGLELLADRWARVHLRDRAGRLPPGLRGRRRRRVPRPGARCGRRPGWQPRGLLPDGRGHAGCRPALHDHRHGPRGPHPDGEQAVPGDDLAGAAGRRHRGRADPLRERPVQLAEGHGRQVLVGGQPVDASRGRRSLRP